MSTAESKAVFLSYASQDAKAARRICEALRAAGVEVWFDQSELRGGDAWDQKIKRQIKECALFVPVISANTNARPEGYFRLEWKLAVDRSHLLADDHPFLFPVVIDDVPDATARVPEKFREVQWTRLNVKDTPETLAIRVARLLTGDDAGQGRRTPLSGEREKAPAGLGDPAQQPKSKDWFRRVAIGGALAIGLVLVLRPLWSPGPRTQQTTPPASVPGHGEAAALAERAYALTQKLGFTRDDLATAEDSARNATDLESGSARAWGVRAWVQAAYINRTWDRSATRREDAQTFANRALSLNPDEPEALNALTQVLIVQGAYAGAEPVARHAIAAAPGNARSRELLAAAVGGQGRIEESRAILHEALQRAPGNVLVRYDLGSSYANQAPINLAAALEQLDAIIGTQPFASALVLKARIVVAKQGDLIAMRAALDRLQQMPLAERAEDRAVYVAAWGGLLERKPERVADAVALTARTYFEDGTVAGPKAWLTATAQRIAGRENLARQEWQAAEAVLRQRLRAEPGDATDTMRLAITLAWLGKNDEAVQLMAPLEAAAREQLTPGRARLIAQYYAAQGDARRAEPYLKVALTASVWITVHTLRLDPWWDKLRGQPEFEALLKEAGARK